MFGARRLTASMALAVTVMAGVVAIAPPASAAAPCPPYSPGDCSGLVVDLAGGFALDFDGTEGGLGDAAGVGTGFTLVQPKAAGQAYLPANLAVGGGNLSVTTTQGIAHDAPPANPTGNAQDNAIGVAVPPTTTAGSFDVRTRLNPPPVMSDASEQAGLWLGPNQDLYVKVVMVAAANGTVQFEIATESPGNIPPVAGVTSVKTATLPRPTTSVDLRLRVDPVARTATAYRAVGSGAETIVGTVPLAAALVDGSAITPAISGAANLTGVFATHRRRSTTAVPPALTYSFASFSISEPTVPLAVAVDFGTQSMTPAAGYLLDYGQAYGPRTGSNQGSGRTFGWVNQDNPGTGLSLVGNGRVRGRTGVDTRLDSIMHAQYADVAGTAGVKARGSWEIAAPDGTYEVTVGVGDISPYDSTHAVNVEAGAAIISFRGTSSAEYRTVTTTVAVADGRLTISPRGGTNTKIGFVDVRQVSNQPRLTSVTPANRSTGADVSGGVAANITVPGSAVGVNGTTLTATSVQLFELNGGAKVVGSSNTSGGNDTVNFAPAAPLKPLTAYRFEVSSAVKANDGRAFLPFTSVFITGSGVIVAPADFDPVLGVSFDKVVQPAAAGNYITSMAFGPDRKLYGSTIGGSLKRWTVATDGSLSNQENLAAGLNGRAVIGLVFDTAATASNLRVWVTHATATLKGETSEWSSKVSLLSGPTLATVTDVFVGLPRSQADHLTNGIHYGPNGDLYLLQGSNQAAGDPDSSWGNRGEKLLTAAMLRFDPDSSPVAAVLAGGSAINVQTSGTANPYNPYAVGAPLTLYATGIRNAFDFVHHSNGRMYSPANGTAGGGNSPGVDVTSTNGVLSGALRKTADATPLAASLNNTSVLTECQARLAREPGRTLTDVPPVFNHNKQRDFLFDIAPGGYYGHPNPLRCEFVLNNGALAAGAGEGGSKYPSGVAPDPNYRGWAYDFEFNKSPNGVIEYQSNTFGGQLKGRLAVVRYSNNNDLMWLQVNAADGAILGGQTSLGITGVANSQIGGVDGFLDPLDVVEDPRTGNLYVSEYSQTAQQPKLYLLRVPAGQTAP